MKPIHCLAFERLLDEGEPRRIPAEALAHARDCARCERSLARARSLEQALERHFTREPGPDAVPAGFTDRVIARVERGEARGVRWLVLPDALPAWVRAAAEPTVVLASVVAALLLWRGDQLVQAAQAWRPDPAQAMAWLVDATRASGLDTVGRTLSDAVAAGGGAPWATSTGMVLGFLPVVALLAIAAWHAGERIAGAGTLSHF